jgi:hypothetical protein
VERNGNGCSATCRHACRESTEWQSSSQGSRCRGSETIRPSRDAYNLFGGFSPDASLKSDDQSEKPEVEAEQSHSNLAEPVKVRILVEAVVPAREVSAIKAEGRWLHEKLGDVAAKDTVHVDVMTEEALTPEQARRERYLSKDLTTLFNDLGISNENNQALRTRTINALRDQHYVTTLRDVLLHGADAIRDTRALSGKSVDLLKEVVVAAKIDLTLKKTPDMSDFVDICPSLDYLPAKRYNYIYKETLRNHSVSDILGMTVTEISQLLTYSDDRGLETAEALRADLRQVAVEFTQAQKAKTSKRQ